MADKKKAGYLMDEKSLRKRYPESGLASNICLPEEKELRLPCRNIAINYHLGGGIKYGSIIEISGEESTGKTLLAFDFGVATQSLGGMVLWDDAESTFDNVWAQRHGLDLSRIELLPYENEIAKVSDWLADMIPFYRSKLTNNEPILAVVDSIALFETGAALETAEMDTKAEMGKRSFEMGKLLRKRMRVFAKYGVCVIFINQLRKKIGASRFEDPDTTPLAQAVKYYASQRIGLYRGKRIRKNRAAKGPWVGNIVYLRTKKNKSSTPRDNIQAEVYFREDNGNFGYHKYHGFDELLVEKRIVKRKRGLFYYKDKLIAKGEDAFREKIASDDELRAIFIKKLGINTISKTRKRIGTIGKNLYPVKALKKKKDESTESDQN
jgi:recombination protein RecA